jgi:hypothetical protein
MGYDNGYLDLGSRVFPYLFPEMFGESILLHIFAVFFIHVFNAIRVQPETLAAS